LLFVTHDRIFLQRLTTRIVELDRGRLFDWNCSYTTFLERKEAMLTAEVEQNVLFDKKLAQEEVWIRKGIEARRTRNEGRVRALKRLREERLARRERPGKVRMQLQTEKRSGKLVIEAENVSYAFGDQPIVSDFTTTIQRGDKVGIIGPNGSGKTTLLRLLLGQLTPQSGSVEYGTNLDIAYFDQLRAQLDDSKSVLDNVGQGSDNVTINGRTRNLNVYLEDFLFSKDRVNAPISALSGGERNRLLLARLFAQPANLLVMDEPTNDLDVDTLRALEDALLSFGGCAVVISHDRWFLDRIATHVLAFEGDSVVRWFPGNFTEYEEFRHRELGTAADQPHRIKYKPPVRA
jgi:ATP-binding cassette subfamily F protein uup